MQKLDTLSLHCLKQVLKNFKSVAVFGCIRTNYQELPSPIVDKKAIQEKRIAAPIP